MNYPERVRHSDDYIDQAGDGLRWRPLVLGIIVIAVFGWLLYFPTRQSDKASNNRQGEISNTVPSGPSGRSTTPSTPSSLEPTFSVFAGQHRRKPSRPIASGVAREHGGNAGEDACSAP
jgi:hypothetical protein